MAQKAYKRANKKRRKKNSITLLLLLLGLGVVVLFFTYFSYQFPSALSNASTSKVCARVATQTFCRGSTENPVQKAIDYASANHYQEVVLDPGTFWLTEKITINNPGPTPAALHIPSNITLRGSQDSSNPSVLKIANTLGAIDIMVYISGSPEDPSIPVSNVNLQYIVLDGLTDSTVMPIVGIWASKTSGNVNVEHTTVKNTKSTGMILGYLAQYQQDPGTNRAVVYKFSGTSESPNRVVNNTVQKVGGDGIAVLGEYIIVTGNKISSALSTYSNCITAFTESKNILINNNTVSNCRTGIGIDGSYPLYFSNAVDMDTFQQSLNEAGKGNEVGFASYITIEKNIVNYSLVGIGTWRNLETVIKNNTIVGNNASGSIGVHLNESRNNYVVGNTIKKVKRGVVLRSVGYSAVGSSYNGIGVYKVNDQYENWGNIIETSNTGIDFEGEKNFLFGNTVRANKITKATTPCNYSAGAQTVATNNSPESCNLQ
ncbi:MAG: hypothetical protein HY431_01220 [Candidatus Levybacteria bacterium]|nr:hypothetical protein [Candidatus Levybacteria bacterium]